MIARRTSAAIFLCLVIAAAVLTACSGDDDGDKPLSVNLGVVQSLSGDGSVYGRSGAEGVELAIKEIEAATPDIEIDYTVVDDASSPDTGVKAFEDFAGEHVTAIIGPSLSNVGFPALQVAQDAGVPAISPMTTAAGIGSIGDYVFRIALAEDVAMPALIERVSQLAPIETGVLFFDGDDAYSRSGADAMRAGMAAIGATISLEVDLSQTESIDDVLADPQVAQADVFLMPTFTETAAPILEALRGAGYDQPVLGAGALASPNLVQQAGDATENTYVASTWNPATSNDLSRKFVSAYTDAYGHEPDNYAAVSYTAVYVLVDALQRAGTTDAVPLRDALAATSDLDTVLGSLSISPTGDASFEPVIQQFRDGILEVLGR